MGKVKFGVGRSPYSFGKFKDHETDWTFKRTLEYANEKCAEIGECLYTASRIDERHIESWIDEFEALANRLEYQAEGSIQNGNVVSACESLLRASNYYRTAEYACIPSHPKFHSLWSKSVDCFLRASSYFDFHFEQVRIPFKGEHLDGYFCRPKGDIINRPTMFSIGGNDSTQEEVFMGMAFATIKRGYNFFAFEYPGHRGAVHKNDTFVKRVEYYDEAFSNALDILTGMPGVDERIALSGYSFGGFVSSFIATRENRIKALIPDSPIIDIPRIVLKGFLGTLIQGVPNALLDKIVKRKLKKKPMMNAVLQYSVWTWGFETLSDELTSDGFKKHVITDQLDRITCPVLALVSEDEGEGLIAQAKEFIEHVGSTKKELKILSLKKDGTNDHCQLDNISRLQQIVFDWLNPIFNWQ